MFALEAHDTKTKARAGTLTTPRGGIVRTPAYSIVGTHAEVRTLSPADLKAGKVQLIIANTYHLWQTLGPALDSFEGLHARMGTDAVIMTDSGGFQVFSLGFAREHGVGKIAPMFPGEDKNAKRASQENLVRITDRGAYFTVEGKEHYLDAEMSIAIQEKLGADIILAFDECTSPLHDGEYTAAALERTHAWAIRSLAAKTRSDQMLYGIVQGGAFEELRRKSGRFIGSLGFDGFAIGGSLGESRDEMRLILDWTVPLLPDERPRHLLGIGRIEDLFAGVERGIDTFDCVIPTREARHGSLWTRDGRFDVKRGKNKGSREPIDGTCGCAACAAGVRRGDLYDRFHAKDREAGHLATIHNVFFFNDLMEKMRQSILEGRFAEFRSETLNRIAR